MTEPPTGTGRPPVTVAVAVAPAAVTVPAAVASPEVVTVTVPAAHVERQHAASLESVEAARKLLRPVRAEPPTVDIPPPEVVMRSGTPPPDY